MIPLYDENPTLRTPIMTYLIIGACVAVWFLVQGGGSNPQALAVSVCNLGMVPGEITRQAPLGQGVPLGENLACVVDAEAINTWTPITSMFLHGGWGHIIGNMAYLWVFGNNVEDSMGRVRFLVFYLLCGLAAAFSHVLVDPGSPVPTVGASGAISGVMGAYLVMYPHAKVKTYFPPIFFFDVRAWVVLIMWFVTQVISGLPMLSPMRREVSSGVAVWAHVGGFVAGLILVKAFENR